MTQAFRTGAAKLKKSATSEDGSATSNEDDCMLVVNNDLVELNDLAKELIQNIEKVGTKARGSKKFLLQLSSLLVKSSFLGKDPNNVDMSDEEEKESADGGLESSRFSENSKDDHGEQFIDA